MPNIFDLPGTLFPHTTSQSTWQFSLGENFLHLSDGTSTYSFIGNLDFDDAELKKVADVPLADFYNNAISKGKAQVHRSNPFSIHLTMFDGEERITNILNHKNDDVWLVKHSGIHICEKVDGKFKRVRGTGKLESTNTPDANLERALLLQELVSTDPIISKFPTHHVIDDYQQMLRIAPELSSEREVVRAFLRQAGATAQIDKSQADALIAANVQLFKLHQASKQSPSRSTEIKPSVG